MSVELASKLLYVTDFLNTVQRAKKNSKREDGMSFVTSAESKGVDFQLNGQGRRTLSVPVSSLVMLKV